MPLDTRRDVRGLATATGAWEYGRATDPHDGDGRHCYAGAFGCSPTDSRWPSVPVSIGAYVSTIVLIGRGVVIGSA